MEMNLGPLKVQSMVQELEEVTEQRMVEHLDDNMAGQKELKKADY